MNVPHDRWTDWKKSTHSENNGCVEVHPSGMLRDSKDPAGPTLDVNLKPMIDAAKRGDLS
jgi:hypothetical protein